MVFKGFMDFTWILVLFCFFFMGHSHLDSPTADVICGLPKFGL